MLLPQHLSKLFIDKDVSMLTKSSKRKSNLYPALIYFHIARTLLSLGCLCFYRLFNNFSLSCDGLIGTENVYSAERELSFSQQRKLVSVPNNVLVAIVSKEYMHQKCVVHNTTKHSEFLVLQIFYMTITLTKWEEGITGQGCSFNIISSFPHCYSQTLHTVWLPTSHT